jgi:hypothetical protein
MMRPKNLVLIAASAAVLMGFGCSKKRDPAHAGGPGSDDTAEDRACIAGLAPFYSTDRSKLATDDKAIKNLQFYLSRKVVLRRVLTSAEVKVTPQHRLQFIKGKHYETITIKCRTPGIAREVDPFKLQVAFDPKEPKSALSFEPTGEKKPVFCLQADWPEKKGKGTLYYEGKRFEAPASAKRACLFVMKEAKKKQTEKHKELKGIKLPNAPPR